MQRIKILATSVVIMALAFYYVFTWVLADKPLIIKYNDREIEKLNEQLITAQILANNLDRVYTLFERNLALSAQDSLADDSSIPFLNSLTSTIDSLGIQLLNIRPRLSTQLRRGIETPYDLEVRCNYRQLGKLLSQLEKSSRLITVQEFNVKNGVERLKNSANPDMLKLQDIEIKISTLTLVKE